MAHPKTDRTGLIKLALPYLGAEGWVERALHITEKAEGLPPGIYRATFPEGMGEFTRHLHEWVDAMMLKTLAAQPDFSTAKVREKIFRAVMARLDAVMPYRAAMARLTAHQMLPWNAPLALRDLAHAADVMWKAAGDRSIDYNYYSKRTLLAGVYARTLHVWLNDRSRDQADTKAFLAARIEDVLKVGKAIGGAIGGLKDRFRKAA